MQKNKTFSLNTFLLIGAVILVLIGVFFFRFNLLKLANNYYPTKIITLYLLDESISEIQNYRGERYIVSGGSYALNDQLVDRDQYMINVSSNEVASSTVKTDDFIYTLIKSSGIISALDSFDGSLHKAEDGAERMLPLEIIDNTTLYKILKNVRESRNFMLSTNENDINIEIDNIELSKEFSGLVNVIISLDSKTYLPKKYKVSSASYTVDAEINSYNVDDDAIRLKYDRALGDYLSRESLLLRTNDKGSYDYLWNQWEESFFGCIKCVNLVGDSDEDGILNILEFVFNTDPLEKYSSVDRSVTEVEKIRVQQHPITGEDIPIDYYLSARNISEKYYVNNPNEIGGYKIRSSVVSIRTKIMDETEYIKMAYTPFSDNDDYIGYITIFLDDDFIYKIEIQSGTKKRHIDVPLDSKYRGQMATLTIILNSVGKSGGSAEILVKNIDQEYGFSGVVLTP